MLFKNLNTNILKLYRKPTFIISIVLIFSLLAYKKNIPKQSFDMFLIINFNMYNIVYELLLTF